MKYLTKYRLALHIYIENQRNTEVFSFCDFGNYSLNSLKESILNI